nr:hypothetical protein GCM10020092_068400 [Actinoplanes digitatis]
MEGNTNMRLTTIPKVLLAAALALTTAGALAAAPAAAAPNAAAEGTMTSGVEGTFTDAVGGIGQVTGTFSPSEFAVQEDKLVAVGTLHAVLTDSAERCRRHRGRAGHPAGAAARLR